MKVITKHLILNYNKIPIFPFSNDSTSMNDIVKPTQTATAL